MSNNPDTRSMLVIDEIITIWRDVDPVECYAAGLDDCEGKLFIPTDDARMEILRRIENARSRLQDIQDAELRAVANKLLSSISVALAVESPDQPILACFVAIWYAILKEEHRAPFVNTLLGRALELVMFEHSRWRGRQVSGEKRKAVVDACSSLEAILIILASKNPDVVDGIGNLSATVANFRSLFSFPVADPASLDELFAFFETNSSPTANELYPQIIDHQFDYGAPISEIYARSLSMLDHELRLAKELASKLSTPIGILPEATLGEAYEIVKKKYQISGPVVAAAQKMMEVLNSFVDGKIQDIGKRPAILPEATPNFLKALVTSGAAISLNYLKPEPLAKIFVTEARNTSFLTLLNVLVHEAAHAYNPLILSGIPSVTTLTKLKSWLAIPFYEATAFHREFELFEAVQGGARQKRVTGTLEELLNLFNLPRFPLRDDVVAFELETRIWRIIRSLRTICDIEINTGERTYVDFVKWASARTELSRELIHNECFTFLAFPGYTPSYSFCGSQYQELQNEAKERGVSRFDFNTKANRLGLLPWTICIERFRQFRGNSRGPI